MQYEYKVVPAPKKGRSGKGVRGTEAKFANELMYVMNEMGAEGWEYVRSDTLPCEERQGLTSKTMTYQNILVFRRAQMVFAADPMQGKFEGPANAKVIEDSSSEILAVQTAKTDQNGIVGVLRARKLSRDGATTYSARTDMAAE